MKAYKVLVLFFLVVFCVGCEFKVTSNLYVISDAYGPLTLTTEKGTFFTYRPGVYQATLEAQSEDATELKLSIFSREYKNQSTSFYFNLPEDSAFLYTNEPLRISSKHLGQPLDLVITRDVELKTDKIHVSFHKKDSAEVLAVMSFDHMPQQRSFDEDQNEFLQSYQKVKYLERGLVFAIDSGIGGSFYFDNNLSWFEKLAIKGVTFIPETIGALANYGAMAYISPWVYSRYSNIQWIIGDQVKGSRYDQESNDKWRNVLDRNAVVDYIAFVHSRDEFPHYTYLKGKKEHQLRLVHTMACYSRSSKFFISRYNAAAAAGHYGNSASPLFDFSVVRQWTYGKSFKEALKTGWTKGRDRIELLGVASFNELWKDQVQLFFNYDDVDQLLEQSELMFSQTKELPTSELFISLSAIPKRDRTDTRAIQEHMITDILKLSGNK